jgi:hypothetical protein
MDERKLQILGAIVEDYVATREPVGSKSLLDKHDLGVSAATVRNDMSVLEEEGLITQPTPRPDASPPTRVTVRSSITSLPSSPCPRPNVARSTGSSRTPMTWTTCCCAPSVCCPN